MGCVKNVGYDEFPAQGDNLGKRVNVCFNYDTSRTIAGRIVRDDITEPFATIIKLEDSRYVMANECQYQPIEF
jgi:hypothetical protein